MIPIPGQANLRSKDLVKRADGAPITTGTVNLYLKARSGANAGKWFRNSDDSWQAAETACGAMAHDTDGNWVLAVDAAAWVDGVEYREYAKESGDLHIPYSDAFRCEYPSNVKSLLGTALTETTPGYLAAGFKKQYDVASPVFTAASVNQTIDNPTAAAIGTDAASKVLATPAQKVVTDANGYVTYSNTAPLTAGGVRTAVGLASANLDTQLGDIPTVTEFNARTIVSADYFVVGDYTVPPTTGAIKTAIEAAGSSLALILADTDELQTNQGDWTTATGFALASVWTSTVAGYISSLHGVIPASAPPTKTEMDAAFTAVKGATWSASTDTLEAIRDRGDSAWVTGSGGDATATNQTTIISHLTGMKGGTWDSGDTLENIYDGVVAITGGAGAPTATITVKDTDTDGDPAVGVAVYVYNSANTTKLAQGVTNASGVAAIIVPGDGTYKVRLYKSLWTQSTNPETLTVSGDTADEYYMTAFSPTPPSSTEVCTVYGTVRKADGSAYASETVSACLRDPIVFDDNDAALAKLALTDTTDAAGYFELTLARGKPFLFTCAAIDAEDIEIEVPDAATANIESLLPTHG